MTATDLNEMLNSRKMNVIDLNFSQNYYKGHIPGAWFALRSRFDSDLAKLPFAETIIFTSPDGVLAEVAAGNCSQLEGSVMALEGGTKAWAAAGLPLETGPTNMASLAEDIRLKARDQDGDIEAAMREYLAWEIELVNDMAKDDDHRFKVIVP